MSVYCHSSERMPELVDGSVALTVTSPPYNVGIAYGRNASSDTRTFREYIDLLQTVLREIYRVTMDGGRCCIQVANTGRNPYVSLSSHIDMEMQAIGWWMRGHIIWVKTARPNSFAWGSWRKADNPTLRDMHEYIMVYSKGGAGRKGGKSTAGRQDFMDATESVWYVTPETKRDHPAPFPIEIPRRLIEIYSFADDLVLDPFCGSGTTLRAAQMAGRRHVGYDLVPEYVEMAMLRAAPEFWEGDIPA